MIKTAYLGSYGSRNVQKHLTKVSEFLRDRKNYACITSRRESKLQRYNEAKRE